MSQKLKEILEKQWNLTKSDEEVEYILTKEEEELAISHAKKNRQNHVRWKMLQSKLHTPESVENKIAEINWDKEIDVNEVLRVANANKAQVLWHREQLKKSAEMEIAVRQEKLKMYNSAYFYKLMNVNHLRRFPNKKFEFDSDNERLIKTICFYLSEDSRFETELGFDRNKGLLIRGTVGLGKTYLFDLVKDNPLNPVKMISMIDVEESVRDTKAFDIDMEGKKILYIDDVGTEQSSVMHFGTSINWFKNFIEKVSRTGRFSHIVISTNLNGAGFESEYGFRVRSRLRQGFNTLNVSGADRRR